MPTHILQLGFLTVAPTVKFFKRRPFIRLFIVEVPPTESVAGTSVFKALIVKVVCFNWTVYVTLSHLCLSECLNHCISEWASRAEAPVSGGMRTARERESWSSAAWALTLRDGLYWGVLEGLSPGTPNQVICVNRPTLSSLICCPRLHREAAGQKLFTLNHSPFTIYQLFQQMLGILRVKDAEKVLFGKTFLCHCVHFRTVFGGFLVLKNRARCVYLQTEPLHLFRND